MCNIFTGWLRRKIKTDVFSESRNFRLWNRTSRLSILMMGTCLEELMEFSISLAETAWEKIGQWGHEGSLSALSCLVPYLLFKTESWDKVPNMTQLFFTSLKGVHAAKLSVSISIPCIALCAFYKFQVISGCWDGIDCEVFITQSSSSITLIQLCQKFGICLILHCSKISSLQLKQIASHRWVF